MNCKMGDVFKNNLRHLLLKDKLDDKLFRTKDISLKIYHTYIYDINEEKMK